MVSTLPPRRRTTSRTAPDTPAAAAEHLRRRGWTARLVDYDAGLEPDLRLRLDPGTDASAVELLLPAPRDGGTHWQAVRECSGERSVWSGPEADCPPEELAAFLESLLVRPERELVTRYERLG